MLVSDFHSEAHRAVANETHSDPVVRSLFHDLRQERQQHVCNRIVRSHSNSGQVIERHGAAQSNLKRLATQTARSLDRVWVRTVNVATSRPRGQWLPLRFAKRRVLRRRCTRVCRDHLLERWNHYRGGLLRAVTIPVLVVR